MWLIGILALAGLVFVISEPAKAATKVTAANVAANWPTHLVIDVAKWKALGYTANTATQYEGVDPAVVAKMVAANSAVSTVFLGTVPTFVTGQLAINQRVWIGSPIQDETGTPPSAYLPIYVGNNPPSMGGFVEVTA